MVSEWVLTYPFSSLMTSMSQLIMSWSFWIMSRRDAAPRDLRAAFAHICDTSNFIRQMSLTCCDVSLRTLSIKSHTFLKLSQIFSRSLVLSCSRVARGTNCVAVSNRSCSSAMTYLSFHHPNPLTQSQPHCCCKLDPLH